MNRLLFKFLTESKNLFNKIFEWLKNFRMVQNIPNFGRKWTGIPEPRIRLFPTMAGGRGSCFSSKCNPGQRTAFRKVKVRFSTQMPLRKFCLYWQFNWASSSICAASSHSIVICIAADAFISSLSSDSWALTRWSLNS